MALQVLIPAGISAAAKALMKTPAGQKIAAKGGEAVRNFLEKKGLYSRGTGKKSVKHRDEKIAADKAAAKDKIEPYKPKTKGKARDALREFQGNRGKRARNKQNLEGAAANRFGYFGLKAGGLVKKKSIDGIAKRGKTRATRSR